MFQYLITGITVGSVYAMVAVGFNIIYNVTEIINFAQGEFVMLGGLIMVFFSRGHRASFDYGFPATVILVTLVGMTSGSVGDSPHPPDLRCLTPDYCNHCSVDSDQGNGHVYLGQGFL